ncbi:hypothetical protein [Qipengyuania aquimaris]|nr:hypothetical protein [Qipengyuania aquimaris]
MNEIILRRPLFDQRPDKSKRRDAPRKTREAPPRFPAGPVRV